MIFCIWWYFEECYSGGILWQLIQYSQQPLSFGGAGQRNFDHRDLWTKTKEEILLLRRNTLKLFERN